MTTEDEENAEQTLEGMGYSAKIVRGMINGLKAKGREGKQVIDTLVLMADATKLSQLAEKTYFDAKNGKPKTNADYDKAEEFCGRSIKLLDKAMAAMPSTVGTLFPLKKRVMMQELDIRYQRIGVSKSKEELEAEVDRQLEGPLVQS
jgi:hypothetical protein